MNLKSLALPLAAAGALTWFLAGPDTLVGQTQPAQTEDDPEIVALSKDIAEQHRKIVENQAAIDKQMAALAEEVRVARIFVSRAGGPGAKK